MVYVNDSIIKGDKKQKLYDKKYNLLMQYKRIMNNSKYETECNYILIELHTIDEILKLFQLEKDCQIYLDKKAINFGKYKKN